MGVYVINLDEYESIETNWIAFYVNGNNIFWQLWSWTNSKRNLKIHRKQKYNNKYLQNTVITSNYLIMCEYFYIGFIDFMLKSKSFLDNTNLFSHNYYDENDKIFSITKKM